MTQTTTFVVSDNSLNAYNFRVYTDGLRWGDHVPMLFNHDTTQPAIGHWKNLRRKNGQLLADAVFDGGDEMGKELQRKIAEGHMAAASIGFRVLSVSNKPQDMLPEQQSPTVTEAQVLEISIVNVPANEGALVLYDEEFEALSEKHITKFLETLSQKTPNYLRLSYERNDYPTDEEDGDYDPDSEENEADWHREQQKERISDAEFELDKAIMDGKVKAEKADYYRRMIPHDPEGTLDAIKSLPKPVRLSQIPNSADTFKGQSFAELSKTNPQALEKMRKETPHTFEQLYFQQYQKAYQW